MMCIDKDKPISVEELWGVPPDELPEPDPDRNHFDEQQGIKATENTENTERKK